ncbi:hypothetical protein GGTG_12102 [Gaeumannomyces tritici R3-111a-1]|uniref:Auxin Efflux Carrier superfamily protein n=1 Tax=Gaeumannomyces tritici (strain R3-111a-1) TaxID=644352 RepID=J3PF23_GAET3|nr:hypothetical protein GGTG_12102 [Gaeumannomyces tritici R3-111a-1]EJT71081.1 hypothetical protein GGTG_12102 [Gaeumannomyces tritici R3-111a-1]
MASYFSSPASFRVNNMEDLAPQLIAQSPFNVFKKKKPHDAHPDLPHLAFLVFGAVMEVVCISLPGYIIARLGHFDADKQRFLANLNVMLFTPCLIFTKLASQLNADNLSDLAVIPVIFVIQTLVSYLISLAVTKCFGFGKRASNFVTAMGVFGNSNSLPISLVISLSQTIKGLHWDRIKGDNDEEVAARGILYLLVFQQLGQMVRWSWGYHVLLAPKDKYDEYDDEQIEEGRQHDANGEGETRALLADSIEGVDPRGFDSDDEGTVRSDSEGYEPAGRTPVATANHSRASPADSEDEGEGSGLENGNGGRPSSAPNGAKPGKHSRFVKPANLAGLAPPLQQQYDRLPDAGEHMLSFPRIRNSDEPEPPSGVKGLRARAGQFKQRSMDAASTFSRRQFARLPMPVQRGCGLVSRAAGKVYGFLWEFMNPPLWAMLIAIVVASVPDLQRLFFQDGSFIRNSVTSAVSSSAGVAVPLILVVLGANLARNTQSHDVVDPEEKTIGTKLLVASLVCRMLLPTLVMAPILAFFAKYVPISILDDPIFVIVCFLLTGAPSALQLAQICQINNVYEGVMGKILFQSYVIWILPSTLVLVVAALQVVEAAK